jgi:uncharacterized protein (DUF58 family)
VRDAAAPRLDPEAAEPLLRRLDLVIRNRLEGLLQGRYVGLLPGPGTDSGESRVYVPGDDVRRIDWPVTARTTITHVRETIADRELETWLVVDLSPSLDFGTGRSDKRELALAAISAFAYLTAGGGNRVGAVVANGQQVERLPAGAGRMHARDLIRRIAAMPKASSGDPAVLARALEAVRRPPRRRGLVTVISDFMGAESGGGEPDWQRPLRGLSGRHDLICVHIVDPRETELPPVGLLTLVDPESGRQVEVQTAKAELRARFAEAARVQQERIAVAVRRAGAAHLELRTDRDWVNDVVRFVLARRQSAVPAGGRGAQVAGR